MPVDPSREYKEHVLANLPADITVDPKDGFFIVDGKHKFPTYLQANWYKTYIVKYGYRPPAEAIMVTDGIGASAHSFLAFTLEQNQDGGTPKFQEIWDGDVLVNYVGFSSLKDRWDLNGVDRTGSYNGALFVTEFTNPVDGWPAYDSERGIETLQYLYWYALTAQAKGCKALYIFPPWSTEAIDADASIMAHAVFWRDWLKKHVTIPVFVVPSTTIVRDFRNYFGSRVIGPYLNDPTAVARGMTINSIGPDNISVTLNTTDSKRNYSIPNPPANSIVSFDITTTTTTIFRIDDDNNFDAPYTQLWSGVAGTHSVEFTIPASSYVRLGFLSASSSSNIQITNWRVTKPAQSIFSDGLHLRGPNDSQPNQHYAAMAIGHKAMLLRRQPEDDPTWNQELRDEVGIVWNNLSKYEFTGLGGTETIAPVATDDPLPNPLPLPS